VGVDTADGLHDGPEEVERHSTFRSLRIRNFRLYTIGQLFSFGGTWMHACSCRSTRRCVGG
jgi:hypothetical protein